ncbi:late control protein D, partial [Clostridium sp. PL3]|nr:late control protein D [Clostridium thailandense]
KTKFWFGPPKGEEVGQLEDFNYSISKKIGNFRSSSENYNKTIEENDFIYYKIETDRILNIGDSVNFKDKKLYVFGATATMKDSILKHEYILSPKNGLTQDLILNNKIKGTSIEGKVIGVSGDTVKVHLQIDENQNLREAYAFPYSTPYTAEGNTGMYCMPEMGD